MSDNQLKLTNISYKKDAFIIVEGKQDADRFFIIQQGKVLISKEAGFEKDGSSVLGPGDFFGVISTMSSHSHIETARALTDVNLISVLKGQYVDLIQKNSQVAIKIIKQFSKRLRHLNETLAGLTLRKTAEAGPSHLFSVAEYYFNKKQYNQAYYAYNKYSVHCPAGEHLPVARAHIAGLKSHVGNLKIDYGSGEMNRLYEKNTMLFAEGEPGSELFIIQKGSVKITKIVNNMKFSLRF